MYESVLIGSYGFLYSDLTKDNKNTMEMVFSVLLVDLLDNNAYYSEEDGIDYHGLYLIEISEKF
jgi:hypothetical protein